MAKPNKKSKAARRSQDGKAFDENALENLTSRLDSTLKGSDHKRKKSSTGDADADTQGRKRQRNSSDKPSRPNQKATVNEKDLLLAEIRALGGDEKDLELIENVDSDDEELVQKKDEKLAVDKSLKDELAALSKELGFANYQPSEASEAEAVEEEEEEEEEASEGDVEEDEPQDHASKRHAADLFKREAEKPQPVVEAKAKQQPRRTGNFLFEPRADWHDSGLPKLSGPSSDQTTPYTNAAQTLKTHAKTLLEDDASRYRTSVFASSSHKFLSTIMSSGTLTDKVSALTLAIQESPLHNIRAFEALMNLAAKKSRAQAIGAIGALVDLLGPGSLLPSDRRLRYFSTQPELIGTLQNSNVRSWTPDKALPGKITDAHIMAWAYEDWLKDAYFRLIQLLETWCSDEIEYSRSRALDFVYGLLKDKPEQEANLLRLLVNKLGDRDRKIASRASYLLLQLETSHPGMKVIIIGTIEQEILLHRSQDHRSKYYAVNTLNQTILSNKEPNVAETLVRIYFDLFVTLLKSSSLGIGATFEAEKQEDGSKETGKPVGKPARKPDAHKTPDQEGEAADKLVSAILTGVNRAAPFVGANEAIMENHLDTLFKIAHSANFNTGIQALLLVQHLSSARSLGTDRFYRTLYESLLDPRLVTSSKHSLYLNLLLRALKNDVDVRRVKAFAKRMLQIASLHQPPFVCGLLYVLSYLRKTFPDLQTLIQEPEESIFDDEPAEKRPVYDGRKRDPEYSNAQRSCLWEMIPILSHFHPSVSVFVESLTNMDQEVQKPDLDSHSLIRFLDKFVYRNAKATDGTRGASIMQPLRAAKDTGDIWLGSRVSTSASSAINSAAFWNKKQVDVAADDVFFHEYFQQAAKESKMQARATRANAPANEEEEEDEIWKALVSAQPEIEGDGGDDSEGFDDLDEAEMASDGDDDDDSLPFDLDDDSDDDMVDIEGSDEEGEGEIDGAEGDLDEMDGLVAVDADSESDDPETKKRKEEKDERKARRKQFKDLPTFASVDDYAELLGQEEDERYD